MRPSSTLPRDKGQDLCAHASRTQPGWPSLPRKITHDSSKLSKGTCSHNTKSATSLLRCMELQHAFRLFRLYWILHQMYSCAKCISKLCNRAHCYIQYEGRSLQLPRSNDSPLCWNQCHLKRQQGTKSLWTLQGRVPQVQRHQVTFALKSLLLIQKVGNPHQI